MSEGQQEGRADLRLEARDLVRKAVKIMLELGYDADGAYEELEDILEGEVRQANVQESYERGGDA